MAFLELRGVCKGFGTGVGRVEVLHNVDLDIERGELVAIVGSSGIGKSTLVSLIAGLTMPDKGVITLDGRRVRGPGPGRGVVFQNYSLLPWLTVYGNVHLAVASVFSHWSTEQRHLRVQEHLERVGLAEASHKRPHELSGGMRQRVALARALATDPEILLLDEPLGALDALTRSKLQRELERIWRDQGTTALLITNDIDESILLADRIIPMSKGPRARLGAEIQVGLARPRDHKATNHDPSFRALRHEVTQRLTAERDRRARPAVQNPGLVPGLEIAQ